MKKKIFDCVKMKRKSQEKIFSQTQKMNSEQLLKFWHQKASMMSRKLDRKLTDNRK